MWREENPCPIGFFIPYLLAGSVAEAEAAWRQKEKSAMIQIYGTLPRAEYGAYTTEEEADEYDAWRQNIHARVSGRPVQEPGPVSRDTATTSSGGEKASSQQVSTPRTKKETARSIRGGKITKSGTQGRGGPLARSANAPKRNRGRDPPKRTSSPPKERSNGPGASQHRLLDYLTNSETLQGPFILNLSCSWAVIRCCGLASQSALV